MPPLTDLIAHLDELLSADGYADYGPNGLQVPGREEVSTVATGVSANAELFERAIADGADLILTHHGLFWDGDPLALDRPAARRLKLLLDADVSLAAYHLPLDGHLELGNNARIAAGLGCASWEPFASHKGTTIGVAGRFDGDGIEAVELLRRVHDLMQREPLAFTDGPARVRTLGIVSGGGASYLGDSIAAGHDAFLTGEPAERVMAQAREAGVHFFAAGHYATETFGVKALGDELASRFGVRHVFVDVPNPI
jgi:dinuclear metal center YbgI/SA1388 family protein